MRGSKWSRCAIGALGVVAALAATAQQEVNRGPGPQPEEIAPVFRTPQPYSRIVMPNGMILETGGTGVQPIFPDDIRGIGNPADYEGFPDTETVLQGEAPGPFIYENMLTPLAPGVEDPSASVTAAPAPFITFDSIGPNDLDPPDPDIAVGPNHIAVVTNDDFAVYDKCGNELFRADIETFLGTPPEDLLFDPKVIYDPWNGRWVMMWHSRNFSPESGRIILVISTGSTPWGVGGWYFYNYDVVQDAGTASASWPDYFDLGFSQNFVTISGNMFEFPDALGNRPFRWARHIIFDKSEIYNQAPSFRVSFSNLTNEDGSTTFAPRAVQQQWQFGGLDGVFINSRSGGGDKLTVWKLTDAFGANTLVKDDVDVAAYTLPPDGVQPNGATLDTLNTRLMPAVLTNDTANGNGLEIFTSLTTSRAGRAAFRMYRLNASTNAVKTDQDFFATGWDYWFGCPAAGYGGDGYFVFCRSQNAPGGEAEVRYMDLNAGLAGGSAQIQDGTGSRNQCFDGATPIPCRWGDYFGAQLDFGDYNANFNTPGQPAKAWFIGEYGRPNTWGTAVGAGSIHSPGLISSVAPAATTVFTGNEGSVPFASQVYTISNNGDVGVEIEVIDTPSWVNVSSTQFPLYPSGRSVTVSVNTTAANALCGGTYNGVIRFRNCYTGQTFTRNLQLVVNAPVLNVVSVDADNGSYYPGESFNVTTITENTGTLFTSYELDIFASTNTIISTGDTKLLDSSSSAGAGGSTTSPRAVTLPFLAPGTYFIGTIVREDIACPQADSGFDPVPITVLECLADTNQDGMVSPADFNGWIIQFNSQGPRCDQNGDGLCTPADFNAFIINYNAGCN